MTNSETSPDVASPLSPQKPKSFGKANPFQVTSDELVKLLDDREEGAKTLASLGSIHGLSERLLVDVVKGLDTDGHLEVRKQTFGSNARKEPNQRSFFTLVYEQFEDLTLRILLLASVVSLVVGIYTEGPSTGWIEGTAIFVAVFIVVSVSSTNDYIKEKQFRALNSKRHNRPVTVMRDSQVKQISIFDLLVGDVVVIETGDKIPADGVLITAFNLSIDESSMTGESKLVRKRLPGHSDKGDPFVISGTKVEEGNGSMLVLAVGDKSIQGKTMRLLEEAADETPLQGKLEVIATDIGKLGGFAAILTVIAMLIRLAIVEITCTSEGCIEAGGPGWRHEILVEIVNFFLVGITVVVVAVPEGLPLAVTISLAYSVQKMFNEKNLVRHLDACETMGEANTICSDKTGTLTQNKMSVVKVWVGEKTFEHAPGVHEVNKDVAHLIGQGVSVNSTASLVTNSDGRLEQVGNKTECALLEYARHLNIDYDLVRASNLPKIVNRFTFSSKRKRMSTLLALQGSTLRVYCKGASEIVLDRCSSILTANGSVREMTKADRFFITKNVIENFASQGLRTLCLAYRDVNKNERDWENEMVDEDTPRAETDLTCIAVVGIEDPVRPEVPDAVLRCNTAGIVVRMVTGDNVETAKAIAQKCHIFDPTSASYNPRFTVMEGPDFRKFVGGFVYDEDGNARIADIENFKMVAQSLRVLARSSPSDKHLLVTGLKEINHVVAVTGDGTNDAPALKKADVGFAMGIAGTEIAKEAADIILMDDNFSSIVTAVKWGRNVYDCIRKFLQFQLTANIVAVTLAFVGGVTLKESPITAIQMLWVNLIMDTFASLALATEPPSPEVLNRKPVARDDYLITPVMWRNIIGQAIYQITVLLTLVFCGEKFFNIPEGRGVEPAEWNFKNGVHYTIVFNTFVFLQIFNEINARKLKPDEYNVFRGFFNNPLFLFIISFTVVVQVFLVSLGGRAFHTAPLTVSQFLICALIGSGSLIVGVIVRLIPIRFFTYLKLREEVDEEHVNHMLRRKSSVSLDEDSTLSVKNSARTRIKKAEAKEPLL